jgi:subtilisin family serine protease
VRAPAFPALSLALAALAACADAGTGPTASAPDAAPLHAAAPGRGVAGEYVVVLKDGADPASVAAAAGAKPRHLFTAALTGFAAPLNAGQVAALRHHPAVAFVEQDQVVEAAQTVPWNLDRIDQPFLPLDGQYNANTGAAQVNAYIIDTGIRTAHPEFGGRASNVLDVLGGNGQDCNGHGTAVAGIVGATTYGVAKLVRLRGVRVLNCAGTGTTAGVIAGIDWVRVNAIHPAVANISIMGPKSLALDHAVTSLFRANVFVAVPAGNGAADACNFSPSGAAGATTVSATNQADWASSFGGFGPCVDLYAPGVAIQTVGLSGPPVTISGTSMAAPHVTGVGALVVATFGGASSSFVRSWVLTNATPGVVNNVPPNTPNRLLFKSTL